MSDLKKMNKTENYELLFKKYWKIWISLHPIHEHVFKFKFSPKKMETIVDFLPYSISSLKGIQLFHEIGNIQYVCWFYDLYKQCLRVNFIWQSQLKTLEVELCRTALSHLKLRIFAEVGLSRLKTCFNDSFVTKYLRFKVKRYPSFTLCN